MRSRSGTYQQKLTQVAIRPLIRGAVIVQDVNPVSPSDGMKIVLQQGVGVSTLFKKGYHMTTLFLECEQSLIFLCEVTAREWRIKPREMYCYVITTSWFAIALDEIRTRRILREKAGCKRSTLFLEI